MCGIAGILNLNGESVSPVLLRRMTDVAAHRGPDGEGKIYAAEIEETIRFRIPVNQVAAFTKID